MSLQLVNLSLGPLHWPVYKAEKHKETTENREPSCHPPVPRMCRMSAWYYNMFIILMSAFMGMGGILLTALAYRPKQITEDWWEWTNRFYESGQDNQTYRR